MAGVSEYSTTPGVNTSVNSIDISEGCAPSGINNAIRQIMADVRGVTAVQTEATTHTIVKTDLGNMIRFTGASTANLTAAATVGDNWYCVIKADGGAVTIDPDGSETIDGATTLAVADGNWAGIWCDGTAWYSTGTASYTLDPSLDDIAALAVTDGNIIVGDGSNWVAESGATARTSLGVAIGTDVQAVLAEGAFADGDKTKLDAIEALADVTDATNVTAAGALMDSELTSIADVKALDQSVVTTAQPTFKAVTETRYAVTGTTPAIDPANGGIQTWTLSGNSTPTDSLGDGESVTLHIDDGTAYTITWTSLVDEWIGGEAPTLATTGYSVVELWKVNTTVYGVGLGDLS